MWHSHQNPAEALKQNDAFVRALNLASAEWNGSRFTGQIFPINALPEMEIQKPHVSATETRIRTVNSYRIKRVPRRASR